jgi:hypothetical protein
LRHSTPSDPELVLGARLLAHANPLAKSESRKRRVWNALTSGRSSRLGFRLSALHVAFASVLCAAVSSAAVGGYYVKHRAAELAEAPTSPAAPAQHGKPRSAGKAHGPAHAKLATEPAPVAAEADVSLESDADKNSAARPAPARVKADVGANRKAAAAEADAELLVEAMRARRSGDARRVSELADEYRARHPQGALQEEALILSVESAVARHAPNAPALAREYLRRFPGGRFAVQARRALDADLR